MTDIRLPSRFFTFLRHQEMRTHSFCVILYGIWRSDVHLDSRRIPLREPGKKARLEILPFVFYFHLKFLAGPSFLPSASLNHPYIFDPRTTTRINKRFTLVAARVSVHVSEKDLQSLLLRVNSLSAGECKSGPVRLLPCAFLRRILASDSATPLPVSN